MPQVIGQRYVLQREIGRGAAGSVWVSRDNQLGRQVAIKVLRGDRLKDPDAQERFAREAWTVAQLRSPHIVQVFDCGLNGAQPFIVMELLEGESLDERLARHPRLPLSLAARIVVDIGKGLAMAHHVGIVHRDIKPANIFLAREHGRELAKLLDFGIATLSEGSSVQRYVDGTPLYMSPEQRSGIHSGDAADQWSLAVVAYQMLTGHCPFDAETLDQLDQDVKRGLFEPPSKWLPELGAKVDAWFTRALARDREQRFQSVSEMTASFVTLAEQEPSGPIGLLFIDDEPDMRLLLELKLRHQLESGRYALHFALDGAAGLELLQQRPDVMVVMTDLNMPRMDGLTFLARVPEVNPLIRVVVVSAYGDMTNIRAAMNQGAFDFLCKPLDFSDLETTIEKCVVHVHELREALRSREENQLLRVLVGHGVVDRFLASVRATDNLGCRIFDATVAYVDVAKFSNVLANAQPQSVLAHLNTHFDLFVAELAARGGVVSRFVGDAVVAIFEGEDHLERAIEACLAVAARARTLDPVAARGIIGECAITVGVDTGPVIAGGIGSKGLGRIEHTVIGTPVSTAARLQSVAQPNEILITSAVEQRLAGLYVCEMVGERALRSGEEPATLFHIVGLQRPSYVRRVDSTRDLIEPTIVLPARIQSKSTS